MQLRVVTTLLTTLLIVGCNVGYDPDSVPLECEGPSCEDAIDLTQDTVSEVDTSDPDTNDTSPDTPDSTDTTDVTDLSDQADDSNDMDDATDMSDMGVACGPMTCAPGETCCMDGPPTCANLEASQQNCGACGNACPAGTVCAGGECHCDNPDGDVCTTQGDRCDGATCVCGQARRICDPGEVCEGNQCRMP